MPAPIAWIGAAQHDGTIELDQTLGAISFQVCAQAAPGITAGIPDVVGPYFAVPTEAMRRLDLPQGGYTARGYYSGQLTALGVGGRFHFGSGAGQWRVILQLGQSRVG